ncbi:uridine-cytidine kinase-like 1 isoform X2 [Hydractinia symbiolongicarpus]|nr:uridine-cytidine kinase-like 1 isoform X2 [Hydractinia symbiolongicarpus]XP_057313418.1 uridine-cytidine kinase-like 1 isoform X2 [Hydractinia symbiolongicarpus]XP_057313419.1 uridine-cytidine kinase-like 1 isoform X2 [Hydractinia symbiolongicarpus]XP_057313420.1 uridine-cytidine kinase-like 1 isoform X2 [Hydractinia symbiolongicarpus]
MSMQKKAKPRSICYTAGRPPWYNSHGHLTEAFLIGICGGSASGKTTVARKIITQLGVPWVVIISLDSFYKVLTPEQHKAAERAEYNFDHADAFDWELACSTLKKLKDGKSAKIPVYDFSTHSRLSKEKTVYGANVIIFEGIMTFACEELLKLFDMKIFVDTDDDIRLARRLRRDIKERDREITSILKQYDKFVKPMFEKFIAPSMKEADLVVPWEGENLVAINLIVQHVSNQLEKRGFNFRSELIMNHKGQPLPANLEVVENTPQVRGLQAIIRDRNAHRDDFVFYSQRLMRILMEKTMSLLPFEPYVCETPQGTEYSGVRFSGSLCGVSILRAGEALEDALVSVCKDVKIGKILIQTNIHTTEPELHYLRLPRDIEKYQVILMDATVATGAAALMAIRILLDHDVREENITFVSLIMAQAGVNTISCAFPKVKIVTTSVDKDMNDKFHIVPGIGNFGNRYFGTELE